MLETDTVAKLPDSVPKDETYAAIYDGSLKKNRTLSLTDEAMRLLGVEMELFELKRPAHALEVLLRDRREGRKKKRR